MSRDKHPHCDGYIVKQNLSVVAGVLNLNSKATFSEIYQFYATTK